MKLYYASSVCSLAVRIILHELNLPCEFEVVNLKTKRTESGLDYLSLNPKGAVPALILDDKAVLTENAVILQYLADAHKAESLLPAVGDFKRYRTLEWLNFISTDLHRYCSPLFWSSMPSEVKVNLFTPKLNMKLQVVEHHLENHQFLMDKDFTIGDSYLFVILIWLAKLKFSMNERPHLWRYFEELKHRPTVEKALAEEGLSSLAF